MSALKISVVMPTYNRCLGLKKVLDALLYQSLDLSVYEVIVADNGSSDDTRNVVGQFEHVKYVYEETPGAAAARNAGMKVTEADVVLFLDDDMVADSRLLEEHVKAHAHFEGSVLGYFTTGWESGDDLFLQYLEQSGTQNAFPFQDGDSVDYQYFYTGNISVRKSAFEAVGGFDEGFTVYGMEDIDLGYRLAQVSEKIHFCKRAMSLHDYHPSLEEFQRKQVQLGKSFVHFLKKFPESKQDFRFCHYPLFFFRFMKWGFSLLSPLAFLFGKGLNFVRYGHFHWSLRYEKARGYYQDPSVR